MKDPFRKTALIFGSLIIIFALAFCYAFFIEPQRLVANRTELKIDKLDPAFDGLKIVAIGDIHGGSNGVTDERLRRIVALSNEQNPDIVVLLGDYVSQSRDGHQALKMPMDEIADGMSGLKAKLGVFAVLGNHDGWYNDEIVTRELRRVGYTVLDGGCSSVYVNGKPLRLLGLKDHFKVKTRQGFSNDAKQLLETCGSGDVIVLEHSPDVLPMITGNLSISPDLLLLLAAHTHGGQVWLPVLGTPFIPSSYGQKYAYGRIKDGGIDMFVTTGIGTSILPIRFMMPPEIAVLTLRSGSN